MGAARRVVLIAGPTASGKSALALALAQRIGGVIVNTDALQVYGVLERLSARPSAAEMALAPHRLYGVVDPAVRFSTGDWLRAVEAVIQGEAPERPLIFVGGTGLYFDALLNGFAEVPQVPAEITAQVQQEIQGLDAAARGALIAARDPEMAARLRAPDPQRVIRALAVLQATGVSLARFQDGGRAGLLEGFAVEKLVLNPDREVLRGRIAARFATMLEDGAVGEVEALVARDLDPSLPAMKAIGVPEIRAWLAGALPAEEAIERAVIATRQYAKRQRTWFRGRMGDWQWVDPLAHGVDGLIGMVSTS
jgi:tRNA dimethylallyltransferase